MGRGKVGENRFWRAGALTFDRVEDRLWCDGKPLMLTGKPLGVLRALLERPQALVTKEALLDLVWSGVIVSESVLTTAIKELRQAIGDDARAPRFIQTVHRRGYRFLIEVETSATLPDQDRAAPPSEAAPIPLPAPDYTRRPAMWGGAALLMLAAAALLLWWLNGPLQSASRPVAVPASATEPIVAKSIAVLPFDDFSAGGDQRWFAEGLTEEVTNSLARLPDLRVTSRIAAAHAKQRGDDIPALARSLNVSAILEGSVRRDGGRVRVTAELVRASDGTTLWSETVDRSEQDVISIQEQIAVAIASALRTVMDPAQLRAMVGVGTRSVEAYQAYLRGLALGEQQLAQGDVEKARAAAAAFEDARRIDPGFARAHWQAAQSWYGRETRVDANAKPRQVSDEERLRGYITRIDAAIATSRDPVDLLQYRAARALTEVRILEAERLMAAYLQARPRDTDAWSTFVDITAYAGDRARMAHAAERLQTLSLQDNAPLSRAITASVLALQPHDAAARARVQLGLRPDNALIQYQAHRALLWDGATAEAHALLPRIESGKLPADNRLIAELRQACAERNEAQASAVYAKLQALPDIDIGSRWVAATTMGDDARAIALLEGYDNPQGVTKLMQFLVFPMFDPRPFPYLSERLRAGGVTRTAPVREPYACTPGGAASLAA